MPVTTRSSIQPARSSSRITNNVYATRRRQSPPTKSASSSSSSSLKRDSGCAGTRAGQSTAGGIGSRRSNNGSTSLAVQVQRQRAIMNMIANQKPIAPLNELEYRHDIQSHMRDMEAKTMSHFDAVNSQPELSWAMRPILVDFLVEVHFARRLRPETLYLAINLLDRYLSKRIVLKKHYQLVGCAALWIAAKYEDSKDAVPSLEYLTFMSGEAYEESHFIQMEYHILSTLDFCLGHPSAEGWLRINLAELSREDDKVQHVARCVMEVSLYHGDFLEIPSSAVAQGAILLARSICGKPLSIFNESEAAVYAAELIDFYLGENLEHLSETLVKKYSYACYHAASKIVTEWYRSGQRFSSPSFDIVSPYSTASSSPVSRSRSASRTPSLISDISAESIGSPETTYSSMPATPCTPQVGFTFACSADSRGPTSQLPAKGSLTGSVYGLGFDLPTLREDEGVSTW